MSMQNPVHPGVIVRIDCIEAEGLTVQAAADRIGVTRQALSSVINARSALTPEMSLLLEQQGWGNADTWVRLQGNYALAQARRASVNAGANELSA